jgi:hypothetical protein
MDTDYLSEQAYEIIIQAAGFDDVLKCRLGCICTRFCEDEDEFLKKALETIDEIEKETREYLEDWGLNEHYTVRKYRKHLKNLNYL